MNYPRMNLYGPLKLAFLWFGFVLLMFILGPLQWKIHNQFLFFALLFSYHTAFAYGYIKAIKTAKVRRGSITEDKLLRALPTLIIVNLVFTVIASFRYAKIPSISFSELINRVILGIVSSGEAYNAAFEMDAVVGGDLFPAIHCLLSPILISVYPLSLYYIKKLKWHHIAIVFVTLLFEMARWFAVGTNKGIFDIVFYTIAIILLKFFESNSRIRLNRKNVLGFVAGVVMLVGAISIFGSNISSRTGITQVSNYRGVNYGGDQKYRPNSLFTFFGNDAFKVTMFSVDDYVTQGYYAFSRAISEPFTPTWGAGHSVFLMENINPALSDRTYQAKLEKYGIDRNVNWHSVYVWWANDVSFLGVILIMFIWGYFWGAVYKDFRYTHNPVSIMLFCLCIIWLFYSSANNQLMNFPFQAMAFILLTAFWIINRRYRFIFTSANGARIRLKFPKRVRYRLFLSHGARKSR